MELSVVFARRLRADPSLDLEVFPLVIVLVDSLVPADTGEAGGTSMALAGKMDAAGPRRICSCAI